MVLKNPTKYEIGKTIVFFVRHGDRIHIPGTPPPHDLSLSKKGLSQAKNVANKFYKIRDEIDAIYSSDMKRAKETAQIIAKKINKKIKIIPEFRELENQLERKKLKRFLDKNYWKEYLKFNKSLKKLDEILEKEKGKVIIIVAHGRIMRSWIFGKLGLSMYKRQAFEYHNCHISRIRFDGKRLNFIHYFNSKELIH